MIMSKNKLKIAIVGCGFVAQKRHIPGFLRITNIASLNAVCDLNEKLAKSEEKLKHENYISLYKEMNLNNTIGELRNKNNELIQYKIFYLHIKSHLPNNNNIICKICNESFNRINERYKYFNDKRKKCLKCKAVKVCYPECYFIYRNL